MANIVLTRAEVETPDLPQVCVFCGSPATNELNAKLRWMPLRAKLLLGFLNLLGWYLSRKMVFNYHVKFPLCGWHHTLRTGQQILTVVWVGVFLVAFLVLGFMRHGHSWQGFVSALMFGTLALGIALSMLFARMSRLQLVNVVEESPEFKGVHPKFVEAVEQRRGEGGRRRNRYYDEYD